MSNKKPKTNSYWNYRVIYTKHGNDNIFQIHEVYYNADDSIHAWSKNAIAPMGESLKELKGDIKHFLEAFEKPVLELILDDGKDVKRDYLKPLEEVERRRREK